MTEPRDHLVGQARFTADLTFPGEVYGYLLRSVHAHAAIEQIDTESAAAYPGLLAIVTAADLDAAGVGFIPCVSPVEQEDGRSMVLPPYRALASGRTRHVGDGVAFLVAESADAARSAAELVNVTYRMLPAETDARAALSPDAPQIWPEAPRNICFKTVFGDRAATEAAFSVAARVVERHMTFPRVVVNPMENRAAIAVPNGESMTLYTQSQGAQELREQILAILGWDAERLHLVSPDVGGAFGARGLPYPEQVLTIHAAGLLGRPVRWIGERSADGFLGDTQARDQTFDIALALDADGRFLAVRLHTLANLGAYVSGYGPMNSTLCKRISGPYDIAAGYAEVEGVFTNTVPIDAYRGAGRAEFVYPMERLVEAAAHEIGMDPFELRRRNLVTRVGSKRRNCFGEEFGDRDYRVAFEQAAAAACSATPAPPRDKLRGRGIASYAVMAMGCEERVRLVLDASGDVVIHSGTQSGGQGHDAVFRAAIAAVLELPIEQVRLIQGDTRVSDISSTTSGSRTIPAGEPACRKAGAALIVEGRALAAQLWQASGEEVSYAKGRFRNEASGAELDLAALIAAAAKAGLLAAAEIAVEASHDPGKFTEPCGTHVCEVDLDPDSGAVTVVYYSGVDDIGRVAAPPLAEAQFHGGVLQGIGQALLEVCRYDESSGQLITGSLLDYALPRADEAPRYSHSFVETMDAEVLHGIGEMGTIAATPAVMNAVNDALRKLGRGEIDAPATPERVWKACTPR